MKQILDSLEVPYVALIGNHDTGVPGRNNGVMPSADLHNLGFDNKTPSIRVSGSTLSVKCVVCEDDSLRGDSLVIGADSGTAAVYSIRSAARSAATLSVRATG